MNDFYRQEALDHRQRGWLGEIQLIRPVSGRVATVLLVACAIGVGTFLALGEYTRKARVVGYLSPDTGVLRLISTQSATVQERRAREGDNVRRGDVLFVLRVDRSTLEGDTEASVRRTLAARERSLEDAARQQQALLDSQRAAIDRRLIDRRREVTQIVREGELQQRRLALAQAALRRLESLQSQQFISEAQVQSKAEEVLGIEADLQALERQRAAQQREIGSLESERTELPLRTQVAQGEIERSRSALEQETAESDARHTLVIRAPQDGVMSTVLAEPGQAVGPDVALASMVPTGARLEAHLFAPSTAVGFLRPDQTVLLRYQAFPYQKFGHQPGHIIQVSRTPLQANELAALPLPGSLSGVALGSGTEPLYRITVALDTQSVPAFGQAQALTAGMQLDADVLLDRRRLIEWIFEPLFSVAGRV